MNSINRLYLTMMSQGYKMPLKGKRGFRIRPDIQIEKAFDNYLILTRASNSAELQAGNICLPKFSFIITGITLIL
ncbi:hypothetical protein HY58_03450 [Flavihumibacter sp. ZG627]|nr:hypothetical protein HY58_03450 [Flavihumibacter sp. ZG627]